MTEIRSLNHEYHLLILTPIINVNSSPKNTFFIFCPVNSKNKSLIITEKEVAIINFLNHSNRPRSINELQIEVWGHKSKLETHTVETHIYRLRKKMNEVFGDENFIINNDKGYSIN